MNFRYTYTRLNVANFETCKAFYRDVLGLSVTFEDERDEYAEFNTGSTKITLFNREKLPEFVGSQEPVTYDLHRAGIVLTFEVNNIDESIAYLKEKGVEMINPPWNHPDRGFFSACFRDPDGNLIELEQMSDLLVS